MPRCLCKKIDSKQCTRDASSKMTENKNFCWQHQQCKKLLTLTKKKPLLLKDKLQVEKQQKSNQISPIIKLFIDLTNLSDNHYEAGATFSDDENKQELANDIMKIINKYPNIKIKFNKISSKDRHQDEKQSYVFKADDGHRVFYFELHEDIDDYYYANEMVIEPDLTPSEVKTILNGTKIKYYDSYPFFLTLFIKDWYATDLNTLEKLYNSGLLEPFKMNHGDIDNNFFVDLAKYAIKNDKFDIIEFLIKKNMKNNLILNHENQKLTLMDFIIEIMFDNTYSLSLGGTQGTKVLFYRDFTIKMGEKIINLFKKYGIAVRAPTVIKDGNKYESYNTLGLPLQAVPPDQLFTIEHSLLKGKVDSDQIANVMKNIKFESLNNKPEEIMEFIIKYLQLPLHKQWLSGQKK